MKAHLVMWWHQLRGHRAHLEHVTFYERRPKGFLFRGPGFLWMQRRRAFAVCLTCDARPPTIAEKELHAWLAG